MKFNYTLVVALVAATITAGVTRYYFPVVLTKTVEVEKEVVKNNIQTVVHTVTLPNGSVDSTTTIIDHSQRTETDTKQSVAYQNPTLNVSVLVANDFSIRAIKPIYGVSVTKEVLGPITVGAFGLTSGTVGLSVGLNF